MLTMNMSALLEMLTTGFGESGRGLSHNRADAYGSWEIRAGGKCGR